MKRNHDKRRHGILLSVFLATVLAVSATGLADSAVDIVVTNTSCAQLLITQVLFLQGILPIHFQFGMTSVSIGETRTLPYELSQTPTTLQISGTADSQPFTVTVAVPGSSTFDCGTISVTVGGTPSLPSGETATLTRWAIPTTSAQPCGIGLASDGMVYFTEYTADQIGQLDPSTNQIRERSTTGGPYGLHVASSGTLYYTLATSNALGAMLFDGGTNGWSVPSTNALPGAPVAAATGPGQVNLWFAERNTGKIARFSPTMVPFTMILIITPPSSVTPLTSSVAAASTSVTPEIHPGNPALPPPIALLPATTTGSFTEWDGPGSSLRVAEAPDGRIWFTNGGSSLVVLDPSSSTAYYYGLPSGTQALALTVGPNGWVWFTDVSRPAIGALDPTSADVYLWSIPGGSQPFDLVRDGSGGIWFTDRMANAIGRLDPFANEIAIYLLAANARPAFLALDDDETVWFTAEQGNYIGRLSVGSAFGWPPAAGTLSVTDMHMSLSGPGFGQWKTGEITLTYSYDGGAGLPVWLRVEMLSGGSVVAGFDVVPAVVTTSGSGTAVVNVTYEGALSTTTDQVRVIASQTQWGSAFSQNVMTLGPILWTP